MYAIIMYLQTFRLNQLWKESAKCGYKTYNYAPTHVRPHKLVEIYQQTDPLQAVTDKVDAGCQTEW